MVVLAPRLDAPPLQWHSVAVPGPKRAFRLPGVPEQLWSLVALLAVGAIFWIPRFEERLPGRAGECPSSAPAELPKDAPASGPLRGAAELPGALGSARIVVEPEQAVIERREDPVVRWLLAPLAVIVGASLAALAGIGALHRRHRPKAAVIYLASMIAGLHLAGLAVRAASFEQVIRVSAGTVAVSTSELWGLWRRDVTLSGVGRIDAWGSGSRFDLYSLPARTRYAAASGTCGRLLRTRWVEPELLAALNQAIKTGPVTPLPSTARP